MPVEISLATASVRVDGCDIPMSGHVLALALYLAAERRPVSRPVLARALFNGRGPAGENAVKVYVHRLRAIIGKDAIVRKADGYAYSKSVRVDLPAIGPQTIKGAAAAGLAGVVVQAGSVLLIGRDETVAAADQAGLFLWGRPVDQAPA